jgi:FKBP-type peptidyl-prolyl cis-trans isomerase
LVNAREPGPQDKDAPKEFVELPTGLKYRILRKTDGAKPKASDTVYCNYRGTLDNGEVFDSSYDRGESIEFPLRGVIPGWTEGLQFCPTGGMIELEIPSQLGYGPDGSPPKIPGGATLHFIVELIEIR